MSEDSLNLTAPRSDKSVWDAPSLSARLSEYNQARWMTAACGTGLAAFGARKGGVAGALLAVAGGALAVRAAMGRQDLRVARDWVDRQLEERGWRIHDIVGDASEASFPASDSPGWTPASATTKR
jgi:hypothetical protein